MLLTLRGLASDEPLEVEVDLLPLSDIQQDDANAPRFVTVRAIKEAVSRKHAAKKVDGSAGRAVWQPWQLCELFATPEAAAQLGIGVALGESATESCTCLDRLITSLKQIVDETTQQTHSASAEGDGCAESDSECHSESEAMVDPSSAVVPLNDETRQLDVTRCSSLGLRYYVKSFHAFETRDELGECFSLVLRAMRIEHKLNSVKLQTSFSSTRSDEQPTAADLRQFYEYSRAAGESDDTAKYANCHFDALWWLRSTLEWYGPVLTWDVHKVTDLSGLFYYADFDPVCRPEFAKNVVGFGISDWNVSGATDMSTMFLEAAFPPEHGWGSTAFDISAWDVSSVTSMVGMFWSTRGFRGKGIDGWDVSGCVDFATMFQDCEDFNADLSAWGAARGVTGLPEENNQAQGRTRRLQHAADHSEAESGGAVAGSEVGLAMLDAGTSISRTKLKRANDLRAMFHKCRKLEPENFPKWNWAALYHSDPSLDGDGSDSSLSSIFADCTQLRAANLVDRAGMPWMCKSWRKETSDGRGE
eukprot:g6918.t1